MVAQWTKEIQINKAFEKWFVQDKWENKIPNYFSWYIRNARIKNGSSTIRKWNQIIGSPILTWAVQWMVYVDKLYFVAGGKFCSLFWIIWDITYTWPVNFIVYWPIVIILTWQWNPRVYESHIWTFFQVPDNFMPFDNDPTVPFDNPLKPYIWDSFTGFTFFAWNAVWYTSVLYISQPVIISPWSNQPLYNRAYDWHATDPKPENWAENRVMTSDILWIKANTNNLYIFCKNTIEILWRSSFTNVWWIVSLFTQPIADWDQVINNDTIVPAWSKMFYMTRSLAIKAIWYLPWVVDPQIWDLTDRIYQSVAWFMETLDQDQPTAFWIYSKNDNTIRWHLRTIWSLVNNVCLIYDLENDTFLVDDNKNYSCMATGIQNWQFTLFAWDVSNAIIYQDDVWNLDVTWTPWVPPYERNSPNIWFWQPNRLKQFRGQTIAWWINQHTLLDLYTYVDWTLIFTRTISYADIDTPQSVNIWWPDITSSFANYPFEFIADQWQIRSKWKKIRLKIKVNPASTSPDFYLDSLSFFVRPLTPYKLSDKL